MTALLLTAAISQGVCHGAVIVITNRATAPVSITVTAKDGSPTTASIKPLDCLPLWTSSDVTVTLKGSAASQYTLPPNSLHYISAAEGISGDEGNLRLFEIGLGFERGKPPAPEERPARLIIPRRPSGSSPAIPVRLLVDDDNPAQQAAWSNRLGRLVSQASDVLQDNCHYKLKIVSHGTWDSDSQVQDYQDANDEFRREAQAPEGGLAIGFSSQHQLSKKAFLQSGAIRSPFDSHLMLPSAGASDAELLGVLLHELGHYFGATHSPEQHTVMHTDSSSYSPGEFHYDPVNAFVINVFAEERALGKVSQAPQLPEAKQRLLLSCYDAIRGVLHRDPFVANEAYLRLLTSPVPSLQTQYDVPSAMAQALHKAALAIRKAIDADEVKKGDAFAVDSAIAASSSLGDELHSHQNDIVLFALTHELVSPDSLKLFPALQAPLGVMFGTMDGGPRTKTTNAGTLGGRKPALDQYLSAASLARLIGAESAEKICVRRLLESHLQTRKAPDVDLYAAILAGVQSNSNSNSAYAQATVDEQIAITSDILSRIDDRLIATWNAWRDSRSSVNSQKLRLVRSTILRQLVDTALAHSISPPSVEEIVVPDFVGAFAMHGPGAQDQRGNTWFAASATGGSNPSAHIYILKKGSAALVDLGPLSGWIKNHDAQTQGRVAWVSTGIIRSDTGDLLLVSSSPPLDNASGTSGQGSIIWRIDSDAMELTPVASCDIIVRSGIATSDGLVLLSHSGNKLCRVRLGEEVQQQVVDLDDGHRYTDILALDSDSLFLVATRPDNLGVMSEVVVAHLDNQCQVLSQKTFRGGTLAQKKTDRAVVAHKKVDGGLWAVTTTGLLLGLTAAGDSATEDTAGATIVEVGRLFNNSAAKVQSAIISAKEKSVWAIVESQQPKGSSIYWAYSKPTTSILVQSPIQATWTTSNATLYSSVGDSMPGTHFMAGSYQRGPLPSAGLLRDILSRQGIKEAVLDQMMQNAKRTHQPLLYRCTLRNE